MSGQLHPERGKGKEGTPLAFQWLRLRASTAEGAGLIPRQGTKVLHAEERSQEIGEKKKKREGEKRKFSGVYQNLRGGWRRSGTSK